VLNFISFLASVAEPAHGENRVLNHSLTHSPNLLDAPGTTSENNNYFSALIIPDGENISLDSGCMYVV